jgi:hypothetical protein
MTQAAVYDAPTGRYRAGPSATTTARFDDAGIDAATAWQEPLPRAQGRRGSVGRLFATPAVSMTLVAVFPTADANGGEQAPAANSVSGDFERAVARVDTDAAPFPEEGVYAPPRPRRVLLSEFVEFETDKLPRRKPRINGDDSFLSAIGDD